jgi:hypothetical protein
LPPGALRFFGISANAQDGSNVRLAVAAPAL